MSSKEAVAKFVGNVAVHFPPPKFDSAEQELEWVRSIRDAVREFSDATLEQAWHFIRDNRGLKREEKWFPVPAEIRRICQEIVADAAHQQNLQRQVKENTDGWAAPRSSRARTILVLDLLRGEMGKQAAREMWIGSLVDYVREQKSLPPTNMVNHIKGKAREFARLREQCHAGVGWPSTLQGIGMAAACAKFADTIEARNRLWARVILGQEPEESLFRWIEKMDDLADRSVAA